MIKKIKEFFLKPKNPDNRLDNLTGINCKVLTLMRQEHREDCTLGVLKSLHGEINLFTLEEPWKDNQPNISCVPASWYLCQHHDGKKFQNVWRLQSVPNRSAILIHAGNTVEDIEGCILLGTRKGLATGKKTKQILPAVLNSALAMRELRNFIGRDKQGKLNSFMLNIVDSVG